METPAPPTDLPPEHARRRGRRLRLLPAVLAAVAFLVGTYDALETTAFFLRSEARPGVVVTHEPAGFRSWRITVAYEGAGDNPGPLAARGYYPVPDFAPGASVPVYRAGKDVRLGPAVDLWGTSAFSLLLGGCLFAVYRLVSK